MNDPNFTIHQTTTHSPGPDTPLFVGVPQPLSTSPSNGIGHVLSMPVEGTADPRPPQIVNEILQSQTSEPSSDISDRAVEVINLPAANDDEFGEVAVAASAAIVAQAATDVVAVDRATDQERRENAAHVAARANDISAAVMLVNAAKKAAVNDLSNAIAASGYQVDNRTLQMMVARRPPPNIPAPNAPPPMYLQPTGPRVPATGYGAPPTYMPPTVPGVSATAYGAPPTTYMPPTVPGASMSMSAVSTTSAASSVTIDVDDLLAYHMAIIDDLIKALAIRNAKGVIVKPGDPDIDDLKKGIAKYLTDLFISRGWIAKQEAQHVEKEKEVNQLIVILTPSPRRDPQAIDDRESFLIAVFEDLSKTQAQVQRRIIEDARQQQAIEDQRQQEQDIQHLRNKYDILQVVIRKEDVKADNLKADVLKAHILRPKLVQQVNAPRVLLRGPS